MLKGYEHSCHIAQIRVVIGIDEYHMMPLPLTHAVRTLKINYTYSNLEVYIR